MNNRDGKWRVKGKSGPVRFLWGNIKHIKGKIGFNRWVGIKWGLFEIQEGKDFYKFIYLNGKIVDDVYFVNDNTLQGKFFLNGEFIGKFTMERIK